MLRTLLSLTFLAVATVQLSAEDKSTEAQAAVGELNQAYVDAFNQQDVAKLKVCFAPKSEFTLLTGDTVEGRATISAAHASFFKNNPRAKIAGEQLTFRTVRPGVAIASGRWSVTDGPSEFPSKGLWYTVAVKRQDDWRYEAMRLVIPVTPK